MTRSARERAADLEPEAARAAARLDLAAGLRHDVLHDREPEAGAARRARAVAAEEALEESRQLGRPERRGRCPRPRAARRRLRVRAETVQRAPSPA